MSDLTDALRDAIDHFGLAAEDAGASYDKQGFPAPEREQVLNEARVALEMAIASNAQSEPTKKQVEKLSEAMWQLLDDMGKDGQSVCLHAKANARIAYEPFRLAETAELGEEIPCDMTLEAAQAIITDCAQSWKRRSALTETTGEGK